MTTDMPQIERTTSRIENIKKKEIINGENKLWIKMLEIKLKFHATTEISEHSDLMKYEKFF